MDMNDDAYEEEWVDEDVIDEVFEEDVPDTSTIKPELKRLYQQHPECNLDYIEQVLAKIDFTPDTVGNGDVNHKSYPYLTKFERTKIIGLRAGQISKGSVPYISVPKHITDVRDIARLELEEKRLPFIVKRPLPDGTFEYWRLADLLVW
jgi:DNA-directed RNA polymerase I, II, and III subunit RPABC2